MTPAWLFGALIGGPALAGLLALATPGRRRVLAVMSAGVIVAVLAGIGLLTASAAGARPIEAFHGWLFLDRLSAFHLVLLLLVYVSASVFAWIYYGREIEHDALTNGQAKQFASLWCGSLAAMGLTLVSNNLGLMWVGIEAVTLLTAFLICQHRSKESLEAMWKYLVINSVGVAFAFMGTLLAAAAAKHALHAHEVLLWTSLMKAGNLNPVLMKVAFIFLLVGYGTKAGLAPMHSWLPDAHSQAPAPVSALFSGFMLNLALYCILRYIPLTEAATGHQGWSLGLLVLLGLVSIGVSAVFILFQKDAKRLLAYSSVEHIGIMALGVGLGGAAAALFHALNHALAKTLAFCAAGRLAQLRGGPQLDKLAGAGRASPVWGAGLVVMLLALAGLAPFALFMSEFQVLQAAIGAHAPAVTTLFLAGLGVVAIGLFSVAIPIAWKKPAAPEAPAKPGLLETLAVLAPLVALVVLGVWMPAPLRAALAGAAAVITGTPAGPLP